MKASHPGHCSKQHAVRVETAVIPTQQHAGKTESLVVAATRCFDWRHSQQPAEDTLPYR